MRIWIKPDELRLLLPHGYKVYLIEVTQFLDGIYNLMFKESDIVSKKDITALFE
jgi:hypothetical protein